MRPAYIYPNEPQDCACEQCPYADVLVDGEDPLAIPDFLRVENITPLTVEQRAKCNEWLTRDQEVTRTDRAPSSWLPKTMDDTAWAMLAYQEKLKFDKQEKIKEDKQKFFAEKKAELEELKAKGLKPVRRRRRAKP